MSERSAATHPPDRLLTGAQARTADEQAVADGGSWDGLLERAGGALARGVLLELRARAGGVYGREALLVAGKGDNGGDAWVAAARLRERGVRCTVLAVHGTDVATSPHSARARRRWLTTGGRVVAGTDDRDAIREALRVADVRVDAVLGTGISGAPRDEALLGVRVCTEPGAPVVACDIPSGVDADSGAVPGEAVDAVRTVTFGAAKRGLVLHPGAARAGVVEVAPLGSSWTPAPTGWRATRVQDAAVTPFAASTDKTGRGRLLVVAGSQRYAGAAALCAAAAVRSGAGLVTLATTAPSVPVLALEPGVMVVALPALDQDDDDGAGGPAPAAADLVLGLAGSVDAVVLGPGCGHGEGTRVLADAVLDAGHPVVLDADGLNVFRGDAEALRRTGSAAPLVLTPHHRELGRLVGVDGGEALADRHELVPSVADRLGAVVVGKGPGTVVAAPGGAVRVVTAGGPALGSGGTGDVLAGMLGAALAREVVVAGRAAGAPTRPDAARDVDLPAGRLVDAMAAVAHRHGMLGDLVGARSGGRATAHGLVEELPTLLGGLADRGAR